MEPIRRIWSEWTDSEGHVWEVVYAWTLAPKGGLRLLGLQLESSKGHTLTREVLSAVPLQPQRAIAQLDIGPAVVEPGGTWRPVDELPQVGRPVTYGPAHYQRVGDVYRATQPYGKPRRAVMAQFGLKERTAARHIAEARRLGYLEPLKED